MLHSNDENVSQLLTVRETTVLESMLSGDSTKDTAKMMGISPKTVETYRSRIRAKFRARNTVELVRMALMSGVDGRAKAP
ncbi:MAG: helix-turn-helix transcriptional regulator [Marinicaulis sp.]|nr:helix-turn-helix transcriptional regulator [Marinicaulis sp.]